MSWASAAATLGGSLIGSLFSKSPKTGGMGRVSVNTPAYGLSSVADAYGNVNTALTEKNTGERENRLARQARTYSDLDTLRAGVVPGFGRLTDARVAAVRNAASKATSNLRDSLAQRRIAGSRFGDDALASTEAMFGEQEAQVRAQSVIEEIAMTSQILDQEHKYMLDEVQKNLSELGITTNFSGSITNAMNTQLAIDKQIAAQSAAGTGKLFGSVAGQVGGALENTNWAKVGNWFTANNPFGGGQSLSNLAALNAYTNPTGGP